MAETFLTINNIREPQILAAEKDYLVVYKPPRMHTAPLSGARGDTLFDWCSPQFPEIKEMPGRRAGEGGLLHRLDYETQGLVLVARTAPCFDALLCQQKEGCFVKEYHALTSEAEHILPGFPEKKPGFSPAEETAAGSGSLFQIKSAFRPYGRGRKEVRPLSADAAGGGNGIYVTDIFKVSRVSPDCLLFSLRLARGFRHQIRNHLAWAGRPILNDSLYGGAPFGNGCLGLRADALSFTDPCSGKNMIYKTAPVALDDI